MFYLSDHGESLGEYGVYLHGAPYALAPEAQTHIAAMAWFGADFPIDQDILESEANRPYSHDNLFHTLLGALDIQTGSYVAGLDLLHNAHKEEEHYHPRTENRITARTKKQPASMQAGKSEPPGF